MTPLKRYSPIPLNAPSLETEMRNGWEVVLAYENEGDGPFLTDLSHLQKWEIQDVHPERVPVSGEVIPEQNGECTIERALVISRVNTQTALIYHLPGASRDLPVHFSVTDVTDAWCLACLSGKGSLRILSHVSDVPLPASPVKIACHVQGNIWDIPCHLTFLNGSDEIVLIAAPRGFGPSLVHALLAAGEEAGLRPAGEKKILEMI